MKSTQNDMPTENYGINDYLDKVKDIRKRSIGINHSIRREKRKGQKKLMNYKRSLDFEK
ncbi:hypothetical protein HYD96_02045 [Mycoplasmopsis bovis]|nr:hypothetical protein [Mycoplasmopsis bovis]QQH34677.1 hypothetical protein HYD96_02045 [Mycoplasmopsis bovis]